MLRLVPAPGCEAPSAAERAREVEAVETALLDEDLADPGSRRALHFERGVELSPAVMNPNSTKICPMGRLRRTVSGVTGSGE